MKKICEKTRFFTASCFAKATQDFVQNDSGHSNERVKMKIMSDKTRFFTTLRSVQNDRGSLRFPAKAGKVQNDKRGSALCFVLITLLILTIFGFGTLATAYGLRRQAIVVKNQLIPRYIAEAGYEKAIYWANQQADLGYELFKHGAHTEKISFASGSCDFSVTLHTYILQEPYHYIITSNGHSGSYNHTVKVNCINNFENDEQTFGAPFAPSGPTSTTPVYFASGEIIDMPIHINCYGEPDDSQRDIYITGDPTFKQKVDMGESRYSDQGKDKYSDVMDLFVDGGISFDQPDSKITDKSVLDKKVSDFKEVLQEQKPDMVFTPAKNSSVTNGQAAVQLEFYTGNDGQGYVRITNNCTVRGYKENSGNNTWDYQIVPGGDGSTYQQYYTYGYHYIPKNAVSTGQRYTKSISNIQFTPPYGGNGQPEGRIYVNGNVIIGSKQEAASELGVSASNLNTLKGQLTIVATGDIWVANDIKLAGSHDSDGRPSDNNTNVLGLFAEGLVKVVNPGEVEDLGGPTTISGSNAPVYEPIGLQDSGQSAGTYHRHLSQNTDVEAAITVAGGGWGAEDVKRGSNNGRKEASGGQNYLKVYGSICEATRGVVGLTNGSDGYKKKYYGDKRKIQIPGGLFGGGLNEGGFEPAPGGWQEFSSLDD